MSKLILQKILEREEQIFYVAWETELIITITNVCCLHLWVYVFISVFLYLYGCEKQFEFQTFGGRPALQNKVNLNFPHILAFEIFNLNMCNSNVEL